MDVLYHASPLRGLQILNPQERRKRSAGDPARVYVARQQVVAVPFMVADLNDRWSVLGRYNQDPELYLVIGDEAKFWHKENAGGSLYTVPDIGFTTEPDIGLGEDELYSEVAVSVLSEERWPSALAAMLWYGLRVVFLAPGTFATFRDAADQHPLIQLATPRGDGTFTITRSLNA